MAEVITSVAQTIIEKGNFYPLKPRIIDGYIIVQSCPRKSSHNYISVYNSDGELVAACPGLGSAKGAIVWDKMQIAEAAK